MKKNIILTLGFALASFAVSVPIALTADYGLDATAKAAQLSTEGDVTVIIGNIIGTGLSLVSVLFFILMIYGGIMWMTARGKDEASKKALDTIFAAIIGIIIVLSAYAITTFVFKAVGAETNNTQNLTPAQACAAKGAEWSCKDIDSCGLTFEPTDDTIKEKRVVCDASSSSCDSYVCNEAVIVCCK